MSLLRYRAVDKGTKLEPYIECTGINRATDAFVSVTILDEWAILLNEYCTKQLKLHTYSNSPGQLYCSDSATKNVDLGLFRKENTAVIVDIQIHVRDVTKKMHSVNSVRPATVRHAPSFKALQDALKDKDRITNCTVYGVVGAVTLGRHGTRAKSDPMLTVDLYDADPSSGGCRFTVNWFFAGQTAPQWLPGDMLRLAEVVVSTYKNKVIVTNPRRGGKFTAIRDYVSPLAPWDMGDDWAIKRLCPALSGVQAAPPPLFELGSSSEMTVSRLTWSNTIKTGGSEYLDVVGSCLNLTDCQLQLTDCLGVPSFKRESKDDLPLAHWGGQAISIDLPKDDDSGIVMLQFFNDLQAMSRVSRDFSVKVSDVVVRADSDSRTLKLSMTRYSRVKVAPRRFLPPMPMSQICTVNGGPLTIDQIPRPTRDSVTIAQIHALDSIVRKQRGFKIWGLISFPDVSTEESRDAFAALLGPDMPQPIPVAVDTVVMISDPSGVLFATLNPELWKPLIGFSLNHVAEVQQGCSGSFPASLGLLGPCDLALYWDDHWRVGAVGWCEV
ncbi:hypothetical protein J8273_0803 [Carpediemonas membranifera]|uniref:Telomeric single stranded DNA binding POT1/Cdc13 domain-containing protein n=1 Tax=Carpediemonas membranifera TaxID=201153 RepID=A0A8J6E4V4_9EUKA|nr:hypothetical protein J8273_0803 [Carpediemonas membranifera]|eukprot:KAG9397673.1 hypothetical protein J8273_0803 [Carpediemonas membranifera]